VASPGGVLVLARDLLASGLCTYKSFSDFYPCEAKKNGAPLLG